MAALAAPVRAHAPSSALACGPPRRLAIDAHPRRMQLRTQSLALSYTSGTLDQSTMPTRRRVRPASAVLVWTAILILYVVWGSTYLGIRIAVSTIPPFVLAATRFAIAGIVMLV